MWWFSGKFLAFPSKTGTRPRIHPWRGREVMSASHKKDRQVQSTEDHMDATAHS